MSKNKYLKNILSRIVPDGEGCLSYPKVWARDTIGQQPNFIKFINGQLWFSEEKDFRYKTKWIEGAGLIPIAKSFQTLSLEVVANQKDNAAVKAILASHKFIREHGDPVIGRIMRSGHIGVGLRGTFGVDIDHDWRVHGGWIDPLIFSQSLIYQGYAVGLEEGEYIEERDIHSEEKTKQFAIQNKNIKSVPWKLVAPHERQAYSNHEQSLETLHSRGGINIVELFAVITGISQYDVQESKEDILTIINRNIKDL